MANLVVEFKSGNDISFDFALVVDGASASLANTDIEMDIVAGIGGEVLVRRSYKYARNGDSEVIDGISIVDLANGKFCVSFSASDTEKLPNRFLPYETDIKFTAYDENDMNPLSKNTFSLKMNSLRVITD